MDHSIEPELLSPTPRSVRPRAERTMPGALLIRIGLALLIGCGVALCGYFCLLLVLAANTTDGRIMAVQVPPPLGAAGTPMVSDFPHTGLYKMGPRVPILTYAFQVNGREIRGTTVLKPAQIDLLPQADMIKVRYIPSLVDLWNRPVLPNDPFPRFVGIIGLGTLATIVLIGALCWSVFAVPGRQRELCRNGRVATGTVVRTETLGGGANATIVHYRFKPEEMAATAANTTADSTAIGEAEKSDGEILGWMRVPQGFAGSAAAGQNLTVLYSPTDPNNSILYQAGLYAVARKEKET